ncbi:MAG: hypothetical protein KH135_06010 [Firmicutes bacterium]|nr:hypothetical protein [Bacillota bacterium]
MDDKHDNKSFTIILCLLIGLLVGALGTYYVVSSGHESKVKELERKLDEKTEELTKLNEDNAKKEEESKKSVDMTSDDTKKEYNKLLNKELKSVLTYLNDKDMTRADKELTDEELLKATCYYAKNEVKDASFEETKETPSKNVKLIKLEELNKYAKKVFGREIDKEKLGSAVLKSDNKVTCDFNEKLEESGPYKVTKIIHNKEKDQYEVNYDDVSGYKTEKDIKGLLDKLNLDDYFDYKDSYITGRYQLTLRKTNDGYHILNNKKL